MDWNIISYGAVADGKTLCTAALQQAIDACHAAGGGRVVVPAGDFLCGGVILKSHVCLWLETGAVLRGSRAVEDYPAAITKEGHSSFDRRVMFYGDGLDGVAICGCGKVIGTGEADYGRYWGLPTPPPYRIGMLVLERCTNVRVEDVTFLMCDSWTLHFRLCSEVWISRVKIFNNYYHLNSDGIDPDSCKNVTISDCHITAGDDCIVIKTTSPGAPSENITVTNCVLETSCAAVKIGTESHSDFRDLRFSNITIRNTTVGCGLFVKDGATMERIAFHNISYVWADKEHQKTSIPMYIDVERRYDDSRLGRVRDVSFTNWHISSAVNAVFQSVPDSPIENLTLSNITFRAPKAADISIRTKSAGSGDRKAAPNGNETRLVRCPAYIAMANVAGLTARDITVIQDEAASGMDMAALYLDGVTDDCIENVRRFGAAAPTRPVVERAQKG